MVLLKNVKMPGMLGAKTMEGMAGNESAVLGSIMSQWQRIRPKPTPLAEGVVSAAAGIYVKLI